jgi:hypothetical protein
MKNAVSKVIWRNIPGDGIMYILEFLNDCINDYLY